MIGKLIYLTITRSNISYVVGLLSQFMHEPRMVHWQWALRVLAYQERALFTVRMVTCRLRLIQTVVMLVTEEIESPHQAIAHMLGQSCYLAKQKTECCIQC